MRLSEGSFCEAGIPCLACRGLRCAQSGSCRGSGNAQAGQAVAYGLDGCLVRSDRAPGSPSQWLLHASCLAPPSRQACREPPSGALCTRKVGHQRHAAQQPERRILPRATTAYLVCPPRAPRKVLQGQPMHQRTSATRRSPNTAQRAAVPSYRRGKQATCVPVSTHWVLSAIAARNSSCIRSWRLTSSMPVPSLVDTILTAVAVRQEIRGDLTVSPALRFSNLIRCDQTA